MPVSVSKSALSARSAWDTGLLLARKVTVLPWNFFQSKSAACAAEASVPAAQNESKNESKNERVKRASAALAVIAVLPDRGRFSPSAGLARRLDPTVLKTV